MNLILTKSPYIVQVLAAGLDGGKCKIYLWKQGSTEPTLPQYTLSKLTPATNVNNVFFDVAPYINEYISSKVCSVNSSTLDVNTNIELYTNVRVVLYSLVGSTYTEIANDFYNAFKGYAYETEGINVVFPELYLLDEKTYYYHYDSSKTYDTLKAGDITIFNSFDVTNELEFIYTNLKTGVSHTNSISTTQNWKNIYRVYPSYWADGNKLEIYNITLDEIVATYYFRPQEECRYTPVVLDFINRYGVWQREFLFKNSIDNINVEGQQYNNYRAIPDIYNAQENLITTFNTNGKESIKCNTGWVNEDFKENIRQLLLSDRILINDRPATITTKQVELQKNINNKLINYSFDFQFTNSII